MRRKSKHLANWGVTSPGIKALDDATVEHIREAAQKVLLPTNMKGGIGKVAYIDSEATFRPDGIVPIAERFDRDRGAALDNQLLRLSKMAEPFSLMIVDSVISQYRVVFTGSGELADRQQKLLSMWMKIAEKFEVSIYITKHGCIETSQLAHTLPLSMPMPLSSQTAIMAMNIEKHFFMGCESLITPGDHPDYNKAVWITKTVVVGASGKVKLINYFKSGIHGHIKRFLGSIQDVEQLASHIATYLETTIDAKKYPFSSDWEMSLTMMGHHRGSSGIYVIRRIGDRRFKYKDGGEGMLDGTGAASMEDYKKLNPVKYDMKSYDKSAREDDIVRYGKSIVFKFIQHATIVSSSTCGGMIKTIHIPPPGSVPTYSTYKKNTENVYAQSIYDEPIPDSEFY